jgi:hypothetical protein
MSKNFGTTAEGVTYMQWKHQKKNNERKEFHHHHHLPTSLFQDFFFFNFSVAGKSYV